MQPPAEDSQLSDNEVIARLREDPELFEILIRRTNRRLYRAVRGILKDDPEVEDVMQEAYVSAYSHIDQFSGRSKFSTWAVRIGVNAALARARKQGRSVNLGEDADEIPVDAKTLEQQASTRDALGQLEAAIEALPAAYKTVLMLREVEGLTVEETAEALDLREETVKVRVHRAKAWLRRHLGERFPDLVDAFLFDRRRCDRVALGVIGAISAPARSP
jgi:RNA polymerase sigma-70 factor (ECF subfamily)